MMIIVLTRASSFICRTMVKLLTSFSLYLIVIADSCVL